MLSDLEKAHGHKGIDTRLIADITHSAHDVMRVLGLDTSDSTGHEVYRALMSTVQSQTADELLGGRDFVLLPIGDDIISFNLEDVMKSAKDNLAYPERSIQFGQGALKDEIVRRYDGQLSVRDGVLRHNELQNDVLAHKHKWYNEPKHNQIYKKETNHGMKPYILAIGDIFTDAFIKLNEDVARVDTDEDGSKRISLPLGSKPPYDEVDIVKAVGPGPNAAVAIARLGLHAGLNSFIGDDPVGAEAIENLKIENVSTDTMTEQKGLKTSYYYVLRYGAERTILVKNEKFTYTWVDPAEEPAWIYLALMSDDSWQFHEDLLAYLQSHPNVKLAFQPGTFHFKWGVEKLRGLYGRSHALVLNREEAVDVTGRSYDSIQDLANGLHELGPEKVVITDGPSGSYASFDYKLVTIPNYPDPAPPVDRTGAGDAFASTIVAALALGETMETALTWAPINSASVVQKIGAQAGLLTREEVDKYLADAPEWYKITDYNG